MAWASESMVHTRPSPCERAEVSYKLFELVTDAEFDRCYALRAQGEKMVRRWDCYQRRWHRRGRP